MPPPQNARTRHRPANTGSTTQTLAPTESQTPSSGRVHIPPSGTLRLRAEAVSPQEEESEQRRVQWAEDVVNNEGMGKKSSKGVRHCCFYLHGTLIWNDFQYAAFITNRAQSVNHRARVRLLIPHRTVTAIPVSMMDPPGPPMDVTATPDTVMATVIMVAVVPPSRGAKATPKKAEERQARTRMKSNQKPSPPNPLSRDER